ncbi:hypothetical protein BD413DRAFT_617434 [Trametes elegans]|nr:hypothetical protein BD413DRAFT_617434 [Trametes elegans]
MLSVLGILPALTLVFLGILGDCATIIDSADPRIQYNTAWQLQQGDERDYDGTLSFSNEASATATVRFTGTSITVYGALKPVGLWNMHSLYYLDGANLPASFQPPTQVSAEGHQVKFYSSGPLPDGEHTLVIGNMGQQFWFDYVEIDGSSGQSATTPAPEQPTTAPADPSMTSKSTSLKSATSVGSPASIPPLTTTSPTQRTTVSHPPTTTSTSTSNGGDSSSVKTTNTSTVTMTLSSSFTLDLNTPSPTSSVSATQALSASVFLTGAGSPATSSSATSTARPSQSSTPPAVAAISRPDVPLSPGAIAGIAVGGAVLFLALLFALFYACRRRNRLKACEAVTPFDGTQSPSLISVVPARIVCAKHADPRPRLLTVPAAAAADGRPAPGPYESDARGPWFPEKRAAEERRRQHESAIPTGRILVITRQNPSSANGGGVWESSRASGSLLGTGTILGASHGGGEGSGGPGPRAILGTGKGMGQATRRASGSHGRAWVALSESWVEPESWWRDSACRATAATSAAAASPADSMGGAAQGGLGGFANARKG